MTQTPANPEDQGGALPNPPGGTAAAQGADAPAPRRRKRRARRRWLRRFLLLLGPLLVAAGAGYVYFTGGRFVSTENAYVKADKVMVAAEVSGPIVEVAVHSNDRVARDQVLFRIDPRPYRIALEQAEAKLAAVRDEIAGLKASYRQRAEELKLARIDLAFAEKEFAREEKLVATRTVSQAKFDSVRHDRDAARQHISVIQQEMQQDLARLGGDADIPVEKHPTYLEAKAQRDRAALDLERTVVRAPFDGIASNAPELGQQVIGNGPASSPVMSVVAEAGVWIEANFKETDLTYVQPGQEVGVTVDTYPDRTWRGRVQSIAQATGSEFSIIPAQNATGNWVKVVQRIPVRIAVATQGGDPALRAGMSSRVEIDTGHKRKLPGFARAALSWIERSAFAKNPEKQAAE